ncbi:MAG: PAS domain-containing protein [Acidobacteriota bacterium]|nr:PAS domain-containing protein [Acidobacteriota bacterium]MDQ7087493.1 PAS domain-containing protein [Acidobacteriota bacterium]
MSIFDALPDAVLVTDAEGRIQWVSHVFSRLFGYSEALLRGERASLIVGPYASEAEGRALSELVARGEGDIDLTAFNQEGISFPAWIRVRIPDKHPELRLVVVTDGSERERLRAELVVKAEAAQREKEILRSTAESIAEGLLVADDSERIVLVNSAASRLLGVSATEINGRPLASVELPGTLRGHWLAFLAGARQIDARGLEVEVGDETRHVQVQLAKVCSVRGLPLGSVVVLAEEAVGGKDAGDGAALLEVFFHQLRTPLASIQGFAATLTGDENLAPELQREFCGIIRKDAARLARRLETWLEIFRLHAGLPVLERDLVDLNGLLLESVDQVCEEASVDPSRFQVDLPGNPVIASVDRRRVQNALKELVRNAVEHGWSERGVSISLRGDSGAATAEVRDWGQGLPPGAEEAFARVASAFPHRADGGTAVGLGLAFCRKVAERHAGDLRVETAEGGGVRVALRLPL